MRSLLWVLPVLFLFWPLLVLAEKERTSEDGSIENYLRNDYFAQKYRKIVATKSKDFFSTILKLMQQEERMKIKKAGQVEEKKRKEELEFYRELQAHFRKMLFDVQMEERRER